jgi:CHAT domain
VGAGRPPAVYAALERGRALSRRLFPVTPPPAESAPLLTELRQLTERLSEIGPDPDQALEAARIREEVANLQDQLHRIAWRSAGSRNVARHIGFESMQELIRSADRQMVLLGWIRRELIAVVIGKGRPRLVGLPGTGDAPELVSRLRADLNLLASPSPPPLLRSGASASAKRTLGQLDELLLAPLELTDQPLVVVPTADLSTLPWNALPSLRHQSVEISPTASSWWHGWHRISGGPVRVAAFAGPGLVASEREVLELQRIWPGIQTFIGREATSTALSQAAPSATIAHVAAHGTHVTQNPLFSSLHLFGGPLFAYELQAGHVPPHVVLSACELGQVTVRPGEEALGLTGVLLQLGVRCVIAGVADVNDDLAADVMVGYHRRLAAGVDAAAALSLALAGTGMVVPFACFGATWAA